MTPDRWQQVDTLFQSVIELSPVERAPFLDTACLGDAELRREVESLLKFDEAGLPMIDTPAFEMAAGLLLSSQLDLERDQEFGNYEILALLGTGGMGEVYLAMDRTLHRKVALKLLPAEFTGNHDWLERFHREARAASALNHPNIMTIHEVSQAGGLHFIATEFIDGETLRQRLKPPGLKLSETLDIAIQVGTALAAAHREGIVHRDIKPENVMVRTDGHVKVVDFGLAKRHEQETSGPAMGTPKYMSPEQTLGMDEDPRSDIFSFGVVLYEMIEGRPPFTGVTPAALVRAIREEEPAPLSQAPAYASGELQRIVEKLLQKNKTKRYFTIQEAVTELGVLRKQLAAGEGSGSLPAHRIRNVIVLAILILAIGYAGYQWNIGVRNGEPQGRGLSVSRLLNSERSNDVAISPDGRLVAHVVFDSVGTKRLLLRDLATDQDKVLVPAGDPVWEMVFGCPMTFSNDNTYVYFLPVTGDNNTLYRIPVTGGKPEKFLANVASPVSFSPDGKEFTFVRNVTAEETALMIAQVDSRGERMLASRKSPEVIGAGGPAWSPNGKVIAVDIEGIGKYANVVAVRVQDGAESLFPARNWDSIGRIAWLSDGSGIVTPTGIVRDTHMWVIPYPTGEPRVLVDDLNQYESITLTAKSDTLATLRWERLTSLWVAPPNRMSEMKPVVTGTQDLFRAVAWSPDGRIVYPSSVNGNRNIWIRNGDGSDAKQLTFREGEYDTIHPSVSPDGQWIAFGADWAQEGVYNIWIMRIDGRDPMQLTHGSGEISPSWSRDSKSVFYTSGNPNDPRSNIRRIWKIPRDGGPAVQLTSTPSMTPIVSPDGTRIAGWYRESPNMPWAIAIMSVNGGAPQKVLEIKNVATNLPPRWMPDGSAITYVKTVKDVSNIWSQPIDGSPPKQLTQFVSEQINYFDWSGKGYLLCSRANTSSELVLIRNFRSNNP